MNKKMLKGEQIFSLLVLLGVLTYIIVSLSFGAIAQRMPLIVGGFTLVSLIFYFIDFFGKRKISKTEAKDTTEAGLPQKSSTLSEHFSILIWLVIALICILPLGLIAGFTVFIVCFEKFYAKRSWLESIALSIGIMLVIVVIFSYVLETHLYIGVFEYFLY